MTDTNLTGVNFQRDLAYFDDLWTNKSEQPGKATKEQWDKKAGSWIKELESQTKRKGRLDERVAETVDYFLSKGILHADAAVIDVGCGPGQFAAEFAKYVKSVVATDISAEMLKYAALTAEKNGLANVEFIQCNFQQADLAGLGGGRKFDLVFASLTPAIDGMNGLEKIISLSKAYCFNSTFVYGSDNIEEMLAAGLYGRPAAPVWDGRWFYALFNLLWLMGYYPETTYHEQFKNNEVEVSRELAEHYSRALGKKIPQALEESARIYDYLQGQARGGKMELRTKTVYGWILWDVRKQEKRQSSYR